MIIAIFLSSLSCSKEYESVNSRSPVSMEQRKVFNNPSTMYVQTLELSIQPYLLITCANERTSLINGIVKIIDLEFLQVIHEKKIFATSCSVYEEGDYFYSAGGKQILIWDFSGEKLGYIAHREPVEHIGLSEDGSLLAITGRQSREKVRVVSAKTGKPLLYLRQPQHKAFSPGKPLFAQKRKVLFVGGGEAGAVYGWNIRSGEIMYVFSHAYPESSGQHVFDKNATDIRAIALSSDETRLACVDNEGTIRIWDIQHERPEQSISTEKQDCRALFFFERAGLETGNPDGALLAGPDDDRLGTPAGTPAGTSTETPAGTSTETPGGLPSRMLIVVTATSVEFYDLISGDLIYIYLLENGFIRSACCVSEKMLLGLGLHNGDVQLFDIRARIEW